MGVEIARIDNNIAICTFDSPPVNLYDRSLHEQFDAAFDALDANPPRALIIRAEGQYVSGGVDVSEFAAALNSEAELKELFDHMMRLPNRIADMEWPTIFSAHGLTLTWAFEVALACDLLLATADARFGLVERVIGLTPTMGGTARLAARAGVARAKELVFTGELYDATTLERWNVVNRVIDNESEVLNLAKHLAVGPTKAFAAAKEILSLYESGGVTPANHRTTEISARLINTQDLRHGIEMFLDKGPHQATFNGD